VSVEVVQSPIIANRESISGGLESNANLKR
jgi:hypothetical protein